MQEIKMKIMKFKWVSNMENFITTPTDFIWIIYHVLPDPIFIGIYRLQKLWNYQSFEYTKCNVTSQL